MKRNRLLSSLLVSIFILLCNSSFAQMVGDCVFLQGKYVEVGIAPNGGYGSTLDAPAGYHPNITSITFYDPAAATSTTSTNFLGFVADYGRDGWTVGAPPFFGDYYLPGTPQEGWSIQVGGTLSDAYIPAYLTAGATGYTGTLTGTNIAYSSSGGISRGIWKGSMGTLGIRQTTKLDTNKLYFTVNVVLTNTGATTLNNIYYIRTVDPDNVEIDNLSPGANNFVTQNTINFQLPNPGNKVLVSAIDTSSFLSTHSYLGLGTKDCRAKCMYFDFGLAPMYGLDAMWSGSTPYTYAVGSTSISDVGIALDFNIGSLAPGDSTELTYAYILSASYIDSALDATQPAFLLNSLPFNSGDSVNLCTYNFPSLTISMGSGGFYHWHWAPDSLLGSSDSAVSNVINVTGITSPLTYTVTGINVAGGCDTETYKITLTHDVYTMNLLNPDTTICIGDSVQTRISGPLLLNYNWTPTVGVSNPATMEPKISPPTSTTYSVTATSSTSACPTVTRSFTINVNNPLIDSISFTNPSVCGYTDGTITLYGLQTGFLDTLHFSINGIPQAPRPIGISSSHTTVITGIGSGVYSNFWVKVGACPTNTVGPVTLVDPAPPTVTVDSPYIKTCVGQSTLIHSFVSSTGIPINYTWTPALYLSSSTLADVITTPGVAGDITYTVTINPGANPACASHDTVHVHAIAPFVLNNHDTVICIGSYVQASITGSTEFTYLWSPATGVSNPNIMNPTITPLVSSTYYVTGSYAHCPDQTAGFNIEVDTPAIPRDIVDSVCLGMSDSVDFTVPGTTSGYSYSWATAVMSDISNTSIANPIITPSTVGTNFYSLNINPTAAGCGITDHVTIFVIDTNISIKPSPDTSICLGKRVQVVGTGDPIFKYQWLPTAGIAISNVFNALIAPDTTDIYVVSATFGRCPPVRRAFTLHVDPNPSVYIGGNRLLCAFDTLHINASVVPSWYGSYSYSWTPAAGLDNTTSGTVVYSGTTSTNLYLTVTTPAPASCTAIDSAHITVYPGNFASITPDHYDYCPHDTTTIPITSTIPGVSYHWYPSLYLSDSLSSSPLISPVSDQVYTIVVTTTNGCKDSVSFSTKVLPGALLSLPDSVTLYPGESYQMSPLTNCNSFAWFPPAGLSAIDISNPVATPEVSTKYMVWGVTSDGCKAYDSINVNIEPTSLLALPNAFTPGNGTNNLFKIIARGEASLNHFRIFNRWGNLVFETTNINEGWDGMYNGKPQPVDVYIYQVEAVTSNGTLFHKSGNVTLLR